MKLEEVLPALRTGKKIGFGWEGHTCNFSSFAALTEHNPHAAIMEGPTWFVVEDPATDEELVAAFAAQADRYDQSGCTYGPAYVAQVIRRCADMVRKRYVDPKWKPEKLNG